ncbi:MAG: anthranilate synthase component I, partial [Parvibaculum sp.]|nr:anthranilate synthase component I [Parvibaculum sp.]
MIQPAFEAFERIYNSGAAQVVWTRMVADLETPVSAMLKIADGKPNSFLLESVEGGETRGRYSIIGLKPDIIWRTLGDKAEINRKARHDAQAFEACKDGALASLRALIEESRIELPQDLPPMAAGVFGYMGYDTVRLVEHLPNVNGGGLGLPDGIFLRPTIIAVFDSVKDEVTIVTPVRPEPGINARAAYARAGERLADVVGDFDRSLPHVDQVDHIDDLPAPVSNTPPEHY